MTHSWTCPENLRGRPVEIVCGEAVDKFSVRVTCNSEEGTVVKILTGSTISSAILQTMTIRFPSSVLYPLQFHSFIN